MAIQTVTKVLDTFTGSGSLGAHTGETGATWAITNAFAHYYGTPTDPISVYQLLGDGTVSVPDPEPEPDYSVPLVVPSGNAGVTNTSTFELDFAMTDPSNPNASFDFGFLANEDTGTFYFIDIFTTSTYIEYDVYYVDAESNVTFLDWFAVNGDPIGVEQKLKIVSTESSLTFYLDNVEMKVISGTVLSSGGAFLYLPDFYNFGDPPRGECEQSSNSTRRGCTYYVM